MAKGQYTKTIYIYDGKEFDGEGLEIEDVKTLLSATFPEIANSETKEEIKDGVRRITFTKVAGTKGATSAQIAKKLCTLKECDFLGKNIITHLLGGSFELDKQIEELGKLEKDCINKQEQNKRFLHGFIYIESKPTFAEGI